LAENQAQSPQSRSASSESAARMSYVGKESLPKAPACQTPYVNIFKHFCVDEWKLASRCVSFPPRCHPLWVKVSVVFRKKWAARDFEEAAALCVRGSE